MKVLLFILISIFLLGLLLAFLKKKYGSPYSVSLYIAPRRTGKSLDIIKQSFKYHKRGWHVFITDEHLFNSLTQDLSFVYYLPIDQLGKFITPKKSVIFIDEMGLLAHKRQFADKKQNDFIKPFREFLKLSGHMSTSVVMYSQCVDIDRSCIEACDYIFMMRKYFSVFTYTKQIKKDTILSTDSDGQGTIADNYEFYPIWVLGTRSLTFIPNYTKYYDSFWLPDLPYLDLEKTRRVGE